MANRQHFKREIQDKLTPKQAKAIMAAWDGRESSRNHVLNQLTEWQPVKTIRTVKI